MENNNPQDRYHTHPAPSIDLSKLSDGRKSTPTRKGSPFAKKGTLMESRKGNKDMHAVDRERNGLLTPPTSQEVDASKSLISPPPEETFVYGGRHSRSASQQFTPSLLAEGNNSSAANKRKRPVAPHIASNEGVEQLTAALNVSNQTPYTPNPKPKKQIKHRGRTISTLSQSSPTRTVFPSPQQLEPQTPPRRAKSASPTKRTLLQSPHAANPNADFILPVPSLTRKHVSAVRRRSTTPMPPYEPPAVKFSSPKEVVLSPNSVPISKSGKKKMIPKTALKIMVKTEPPEIDLTKPMPPPSPTDDPLLLSGPPVRRSRSLFKNCSRNNDAIVRRPRSSTIYLSPGMASSSSPDSRSIQPVHHFNSNVADSTDLSMDDADIHLPIFDLSNIPSNAGFTSDDDDDLEEQGEGTYTGNYTMMKVPTKEDPPTSGTRERAEQWGRPISPFPKVTAVVEEGSDDVEMGLGAGHWHHREEVEKEEGSRVIESEGNGSDMQECAVPSDFEESTKDTLKHYGLLLDANESNDISCGSAAFDFEPSSDVYEGDVDCDMDGPVDDESDGLGENGAELKGVAPEDQDDHEQGDISIRVHFGDDSVDRSFREEELYPGVDRIVTVNSEVAYESLEPSGDRDMSNFDIQYDSAAALSAVGNPVDSFLNVNEISSQNVPASEKHYPLRVTSREADEDELDTDVVRELSCEPQLDEENDDHESCDSTELLRKCKSRSPLNTVRPLPSGGSIFGDERVMTPRFPNDPFFAADRSPSPLQQTDDHLQADPQGLNINQATVSVSNVGSDSSQDDESEEDASVVQITSEDPKAAARAAAILKMHDYDWLPRIFVNKRRYSHGNADAVTRRARRKGLLGSGISKPVNPKTRRTTVGGVIGDQVFIPGSPATTLPELLQEAEVTLDSPVGLPCTSMDPFQSPRISSVMKEPGLGVPDVEMGDSRAWTRDDWKLLDTCFTDERLDVGTRTGQSDDILAAVDDVEVANVVARFVALKGGVEMVDRFGREWARSSLCARVQALQKKQRSGIVAPPTPRSTPTSTLLSKPSIEVPDFTPLPRRARPPRKSRPTLPLPATDPPSKGLAWEKPKLPPSLLGPRYSHLLEEAIAVSQDSAGGTALPSSSSGQLWPAMDNSSAILADQTPHHPVPSPSTKSRIQPPAGIGKRVKRLIFSYLPTTSKQITKPLQTQPQRLRLPVPPPEVLEKPRGPISTPIRAPAPRPTHPKELVHLQPAPPPKSSLIPRVSKPQRLVELHPLPPSIQCPPIHVPRSRCSSGGSVKDLVRSFEDLENCTTMEKDVQQRVEIWKARSTHEGWGQTGGASKPIWKP